LDSSYSDDLLFSTGHQTLLPAISKTRKNLNPRVSGEQAIEIYLIHLLVNMNEWIWGKENKNQSLMEISYFQLSLLPFVVPFHQKV